MAGGTALEDSWSNQLRGMLNRSDLRSFELINYAVSGYCLCQYVAVIEQKVLQYNPDLVVVGFCGRRPDVYQGGHLQEVF